MKRTRIASFIALVVLQMLVVGNMARSGQAVLASGERVTLATAPIDPRDLFRGDYVVLRYDISTIDLSDTRWEAQDRYVGQTVQVVLDTGPRIAGPIAVIGGDHSSGGLAIRGTVTSVGDRVVVIEYGIEEYFVPEGTGRAVETARTVEVVVAINDSGDAVIDHLILDGQVWVP